MRLAADRWYGGELVGGDMRRQWWLESDETSWKARASLVVGVVVAHIAVFWVMGRLAPESGGSGGGSSSIHVRVSERSSPSAPASARGKVPIKRGRPAPLVKKSATAPKVPAPLKPTPDDSVAEAVATPNAPLPTPTPEGMGDPLGNPNVSRGLSKFLPSSNGRYLDEQRQLGAENSATRADREEEFIPKPEMPGKVNRPRVVTTEFSTLAYRLELERRFASAWGEVRTLPPGSRFLGIPGELIAYNVIINRDGTLRRIVNVSALEQAGRDYADVDRLVHDFADHVFPMNPLPDRIRDDPFVLRWTLRFVGNRWGLF